MQADPDTGQEEEVEIELVVLGSMGPAITVESMDTKRLTVGS